MHYLIPLKGVKIILIRDILTVKPFANTALFGIYSIVVNQLNKLTALFQNYALFAFLRNIATFELLRYYLKDKTI